MRRNLEAQARVGPSLIIAPLVFAWMLRGAWRWCKDLAEAANSPD